MADGNAQTRTERLKAALRENLKRRKAQARERSGSERQPAADAEGEPEPTRGPRAD
jgi:hypothetical protein